MHRVELPTKGLWETLEVIGAGIFLALYFSFLIYFTIDHKKLVVPSHVQQYVCGYQWDPATDRSWWDECNAGSGQPD